MSRVGEINYNNFGSKMKIIAYRSYNDIDIYFEKYNWIKYNAKLHHFLDGNVSCPYEKRIFNVGFMGEYDFSNEDINMVKNAKKKWRNMLRRAYDVCYKEKNYTYENCYVCEEWHNFSNFYKWYKENYYEIKNEKMELDKDILFKGNKIYSSETCIFVPHRINVMFIKNKKNKGKLPTGVTEHNGKLEVRCTNEKKERIIIGYFRINQITEAFMCYKNFKEKIIKRLADEYKELIPIKLYEAMYKYEIEIND